MKSKTIWTISYGILLLGFTLYIVLDTFVLTKGIQKVEPGQSFDVNININTSAPTEIPSITDVPDIKPTITDTQYVTPTISGTPSSPTVMPTIEPTKEPDKDAPISVTMTYNTYREYDTDIYVVDVYFSNVMAIQTALADDTYGQNIKDTTSNIAKDHNAFFAVNGDYYGIRERGYVIRNGILYRSIADNRECFVIYKDGSVEVVNEKTIAAEELLEKGAWQVFTFGPGLLIDKEIHVGEKDEVALALASNPRTAIGYYNNNHYCFVVSDGRTEQSAGLSLYQLAKFMKSIGVITAYNLDGGGSSTMYLSGEVINKPTADGIDFKERRITDIVYIAGKK